MVVYAYTIGCQDSSKRNILDDAYNINRNIHNNICRSDIDIACVIQHEKKKLRLSSEGRNVAKHVILR